MKRLIVALFLALATCTPAHAVVDGDCDYVQGTNSTQQLANGCAEEIGAILTALAGLSAVYAPLVHVHAISDVTGLSAALSAKLDASAVSAFALTLLDDASAAAMRTTLGLGTAAQSATGDFAPANPTLGTQTQGNYVAGLTNGFGIAVTGTPGEGWSPTVAVTLGGTLTDENCLTYEATGPAIEVQSCGAGGSDPWTYSILSSDFATTSTTPQDVFGLSLPTDQLCEIEAMLLLATAASGDAPRPGWKWPTAGVTIGAGQARVHSSSTAVTARIMSVSEGNADITATATPGTTDAILATYEALVRTSSPVTGNFIVTLRSEVGTTTVTVLKDSFIRHRCVNLQ